MRSTMLTMVLALVLATGAWGFAQTDDTEQSDKARDPVCNIMVTKNPELSVKYGDTTYYFCMKKDMVAFQKDPEKYLSGRNHSHPDPDS